MSVQKATFPGWNPVLGSFRYHWLRIFKGNSEIQNGGWNMVLKYKIWKVLKCKKIWFGWGSILGSFWERSLRIWSQNLEKQNGGYNIAARNAKSYSIWIRIGILRGFQDRWSWISTQNSYIFEMADPTWRLKMQKVIWFGLNSALGIFEIADYEFAYPYGGS